MVKTEVIVQKTWFITGASRGFGVEIAKAALRAGDRVVAAGRNKATVEQNLGNDSDRLLCVELDVTRAEQARSAIDAAVRKFGGIDVLVNNAGYGHLGFFEENTMEDVKTQFSTNVFGVFNVTWAALPVMRQARSGHIYNMSSVAGMRGNEFASLYSASKFALEGFSESLSKELAPFGIFVTIVEPGPFRTDFLTNDSLRYGAQGIADYDQRRGQVRATFEVRNHKQPGDPTKLAEALVRLAAEPQPPLRFAAGAFAVKTIEAKLADMRHELERWRQASIDTDYAK
jgi:NAD(P)-dependent dehydrogenase (short-subunit alcohol dehydrogenase family)